MKPTIKTSEAALSLSWSSQRVSVASWLPPASTTRLAGTKLPGDSPPPPPGIGYCSVVASMLPMRDLSYQRSQRGAFWGVRLWFSKWGRGIAWAERGPSGHAGRRV